MLNRAAYGLLCVAIAQLLLGTIVVASAAASQRAAEVEHAEFTAGRLDTRLASLEEFRLDAAPRLAVLERMATDVEEMRRITYGVVLALVLNLGAQLINRKKTSEG